MQYFPGQGAEILYQEPVAARRDDSAAGLRAREAEPLKGDGLVSRVNQPLCGSRSREACTDDDNVCCMRCFQLKMPFKSPQPPLEKGERGGFILSIVSNVFMDGLLRNNNLG